MANFKFLLLWLLQIPLFTYAQNNIATIDSISQLPYDQLTANLYENKKELEQARASIETPTDSVLINYLTPLATINHLLGNFDESAKSKEQLIQLYEKNNDINGMAQTYYGLGWGIKDRELKKAEEYIAKSIKLFEGLDKNHLRLREVYDNYGVIKERQQELDSALIFYGKALNLKRATNDEVGMPYSLQKMAVALAKLQKFTESEKALQDALSASIINNDSLALAETYAYYGDVEVLKPNENRAIQQFERSLAISEKKNYNYLIKYNLEQLSGLYKKKGLTKKALDYYTAYTNIKDSMLNESSQRTVSQLEVAFDTAEKEKRIELLDKENKIKSLRARQALGLAALGLLGIGLLLLLRNRQQLKHKSELATAEIERIQASIAAEERERERIARELHDGVGQMIAATRMNVSVLEDDVNSDGKEVLSNSLTLLDKTAQEIRSISHQLLPVSLQNKTIVELLQEQVASINAQSKLQIEFEHSQPLIIADKETELHLLRIAQELLKNGVKHSVSDKIKLGLQSVNGQIELSYRDWGKGINMAALDNSKGIGWKNINTRVNALKGNISISQVSPGTQVIVTV